MKTYPIFYYLPIKLFWTKDDKPLMASTRFTTNYEPNTGEIDVFFNFVKFIDTGLYKCRAENTYGCDETFMNMLIVDIPGIDERSQTQNPNAFKILNYPFGAPSSRPEQAVDLQPPVVIVPLQDTKVFEEQPSFLSCKIIGNPKPKVVEIEKRLQTQQKIETFENCTIALTTLIFSY